MSASKGSPSNCSIHSSFAPHCHCAALSKQKHSHNCAIGKMHHLGFQSMPMEVSVAKSTLAVIKSPSWASNAVGSRMVAGGQMGLMSVFSSQPNALNSSKGTQTLQSMFDPSALCTFTNPAFEFLQKASRQDVTCGSHCLMESPASL